MAKLGQLTRVKNKINAKGDLMSFFPLMFGPLGLIARAKSAIATTTKASPEALLC
jgi:hypothetical protein